MDRLIGVLSKLLLQSGCNPANTYSPRAAQRRGLCFHDHSGGDPFQRTPGGQFCLTRHPQCLSPLLSMRGQDQQWRGQGSYPVPLPLGLGLQASLWTAEQMTSVMAKSSQQLGEPVSPQAPSAVEFKGTDPPMGKLQSARES